MTRKGKKPVEHRQYGPLPKMIRARLVNSISFYFSNLPDYTKKTELCKVFDACGKVKDVFIPSKRNKEGKRFGFVRFFDEGSSEGLLLKLQQIQVHSAKLKVNLSRFERDSPETRQVVAEEPVKIQPTQAVPPSPTVVAGVSYTDVVVHQPSVSSTAKAEVTCEVPEDKV